MTAMPKAQPVEIANISTADVAESCGVCQARIRQILAELQIPYVLTAGRIFLTKSQVELVKQRNTRRGRIPNTVAV